MSGLPDIPWTDEGPNHLEDALRLADSGLYIFPLKVRDKVPATPNGFKNATRDPRQIRTWWTNNNALNIGVSTGPSGLLVVDIDGPDGEDAWQQLHHDRDPVETLVVETGRGRHLYYRHNHDDLKLGNSRQRIGQDIDTRGAGGYVIAPPSIHPSGRNYRWADPSATVVDLPDYLLELLKPKQRQAPTALPTPRRSPQGLLPYVTTALANEIRDLASTSSGRNDALNRAAFNLGQLIGAGVLDRGTAENELWAAATSNGHLDKHGEHKTRGTIQSGLNSGEQQPRAIPEPRDNVVQHPAARRRDETPVDDYDYGDPGPTDDLEVDPQAPSDGGEPPSTPPAGDDDEIGEVLGIPWTGGGETFHAQLFIDQHAEELRHASGAGWLTWDGTRWYHDGEDKPIVARYRSTNETLRKHAGTLAKRKRALIRSEAKAAARSSAMRGALGYASADPRVSVIAGALDRDPWLLNARNGTIDLRTGKLRGHDPQDLITKSVTVDYDPDATSEHLERFLSDLVSGDQQMLNYLQRFLGYGISGLVSEERALYGHGPGGTGKTTLIEAIKALLGDYSTAIDPELLTKTSNSRGGMGPSPELLAVRGRRMVFISEPDEGAALAAGRFKALVSGDTITARAMHSNVITEFRPCALLVFTANHRMRASANDSGIWRRLVPFPFLHVPEKRDEALKGLLLQERAQQALLAWLVRGFQMWRKDHLADPPEKVQVYAREYQREGDHLADWLDDNCVVTPKAMGASAALFTDYEKWAESVGEKRPLGRRRWANEMVARGFEPTRTNTLRLWGGVALRDHFGPDPEGDDVTPPSAKTVAGGVTGVTDALGDASGVATVTPADQSRHPVNAVTEGDSAAGVASDANSDPSFYRGSSSSSSSTSSSTNREQDSVTSVTASQNPGSEQATDGDATPNDTSPKRHQASPAPNVDDIDLGGIW